MDSQKYLVRQRRNRVYGCAQLNTGSASDGFSQVFLSTVRSLQSDVHLTMEQCFGKAQKEEVRNSREKQLLESALDHFGVAPGSNVFVDMSTSSSRNPECNLNAATCVTPMHPIYSAWLGRYLKPVEILSCQGIWRADAENTEAFDRMVDSQGQELAGNSFTGTTVQAVTLAALIACDAWRRDASDTGGSPPMAFSDRVPPRRLRQKTPASLAFAPVAAKVRQLANKKKKKHDPSKEDTERDTYGKGKHAMASIWDKEMICQAHEAAVKKGVKKMCAHMEGLKLTGYFRGCFCGSKWGKARKEQNWTLLCKTAPAICKRFKELPNSVRRILNMSHLKNEWGYTQKADSVHIPYPLQVCIEDMVMERIVLGEEVTMQFVANTMSFAIDLWNESVGTMQNLFYEKSLEMLQQQDANFANLSEDDVDKAINSMTDAAMQMLKPICICPGDASVKKRAQRLCNQFGIKPRSNEKPGAHLEYDHPALEKVRIYVRHTARERGVHERLIANFDQVWSTNYRPQKKTLQKPASWRNRENDPLTRSLYMRKVRHNLERSLDLPLTEDDPSAPQVKTTASVPQVTGLAAARGTVDEWRVPRTVTTLSFIDGYVGRAYVTVSAGTVSEAVRARVNKELSKYIYVADVQPGSHNVVGDDIHVLP